MAEPSTPLDVTVVTGMSGAGRSAAADVLEDLGFFVIDNLPPALIPKVAELGRGREGASRFALVVDTRAGEYLPDLESALAELRESGARTRVLFLDASDEVLVRRFDATRRRHPVAESDRVSDGITRERELLERIKEQADVRKHFDSYVRETAGTSPVDELHKLSELKDKGAISDAEYEKMKANLVG